MVSRQRGRGKQTLAHPRGRMSRPSPSDAGLSRWHFRRWALVRMFYVSRETLRIARAAVDVSRETLALVRAMFALFGLLIVVPDSPRRRARVDAELRARGLDRPTRRPD